MAGAEDNGKPLQVVHVNTGNDGNVLMLDSEKLMEILGRDDVKDELVVLFSIAGAFRTGKSFLLNLLMRYLKALENGNTKGWIGKKDERLTGFEWKQGAEPTTSGILMWSKPFHITTKDKKKVAVVLMDTQGLFESTLSDRDAMTIFALSTMISSIQVYNIMGKFEEHELKSLELFTEMCKIVGVLANDQEKPIQRLVYLLRDWIDASNYPFGEVGGRAYLDATLELHDHQTEEAQRVRKHINECSDKFECFLLPHPGHNAAENKGNESADSESSEEEESMCDDFVGQIKLLRKKFKKFLKRLCPFLLGPDSMLVKRNSYREMTGKEIAESFLAYIALFQSGKIPSAATTLEAMVKEFNHLVLKDVIALHSSEVAKVCYDLGKTQENFNGDEIRDAIETVEEDTRKRFLAKARGDAGEKDLFLQKLEKWFMKTRDAEIFQQMQEKLLKEAESDRLCREAMKSEKQNFNEKIQPQIQDTLDEENLRQLLVTYKDEAINAFQEQTKDLDTALYFKSELDDYMNQQLEVQFQKHKTRMLEMNQKGLYETVIATVAKNVANEYKRDIDMKIIQGGFLKVHGDLPQKKEDSLAIFAERTKDLPSHLQKEFCAKLDRELTNLQEKYAVQIWNKFEDAEYKCNLELEHAKSMYRNHMKSFSSSSRVMVGDAVEKRHGQSKELARHYFKACVALYPVESKIFSDKLEEFFATEFPEVQKECNEIQRIREKNMECAKKALAMYESQMKEKSEKGSNEVHMKEQHTKWKEKALKMFDTTVQPTEDIDISKEKLECDISRSFDMMLTDVLRKSDAEAFENLIEAKKKYQEQMTLLSGNKAVPSSELESMHEKAMIVAQNILESAHGNPEIVSRRREDFNLFCRTEYRAVKAENKRRSVAEEQQTCASAEAESRRMYQAKMEGILVNCQEYVEESELEKHHKKYMFEAMSYYKDKTKGVQVDTIKTQLERELSNMKVVYESLNETMKSKKVRVLLANIPAQADLVYHEHMKRCRSDRPLEITYIYDQHENAKSAALRKLQESLANNQNGSDMAAECIKQMNEYCEKQLETYLAENASQINKKKSSSICKEILKRAISAFDEHMSVIYGRHLPPRTDQQTEEDMRSCFSKALHVLHELSEKYPEEQSNLKSKLSDACEQKKDEYLEVNERNKKFYEAEIDMACQTALRSAKYEYGKTMEEACELGKTYRQVASLEEIHKESKNAAVAEWDRSRPDNEEICRKYRETLEQELAELYTFYKDKNELNNPQYLPEQVKIIETLGECAFQKQGQGKSQKGWKETLSRKFEKFGGILNPKKDEHY